MANNKDELKYSRHHSNLKKKCLYVISRLFQRNKCFSVFAGAKRRRGEIGKFHFLIPATVSLQKVPESAGNSGVFPNLYCCAKPGL